MGLRMSCRRWQPRALGRPRPVALQGLPSHRAELQLIQARRKNPYKVYVLTCN